MRKNLIMAGLWVFIFVFQSGCSRTKQQIETKSTQKAGPDPGYYEQYRIMKANEAGEILVGLRNDWYAHDAKNFKKAGNLFNVLPWGPDHVGGRTRALLIDLNDNNHILAGSVSGGVWQSKDRGKSWKQNDDHALSLAVTCITQNPFNKDVIYHGTGETMGNSAGIAGNGIFKSEDNGQTFTQLAASNNSNFTQIWDIKHSLTDSLTFYVATANTGLWKSTDGGLSFTKIYNTSNNIHEIEVFADTTVMFAHAGNGIYTFHELKNQNVKLGGGLPTSSFDRISFDYCDAKPNEIYAQFMSTGSTSENGIYRSSDKGKTWTKKNSPSATTISYSWAWYCLDIAVHPTNPEWVASVAVSPGYSANGGITWSELYPTHADYHTIRFFKGEDNFLIGNDGGIFEYSSTNPSSGAINLNKGYEVTQFYAGAYFPDGMNLIAGAQDNGTWTSFNQNQVFNSVLGGDGSYCGIHQQNGNTMYASWQNGTLRRSNNRFGTSWTDIDNSLQSSGDGFWFINPFEVNAANGDQLYFPTKKRIWRSLNQGTQWQAITNNVAGTLYTVAATEEESPTLYMAGQSSLLYRVKNAKTAVPGNETMLTMRAPSAARNSFIGNIEINPVNNTTIYLSMNNISSNPRLWKVWNADQDTPTWVNISGNLPAQLPVNWVEVDAIDTNIIVAATDFGLYSTVNGGVTWEKELGVPNVSIHMIKLRNSDGMLFVFTHGRGVFKARTRPGSNAGMAARSFTNEISIFPNPASEWIEIQASQPIAAIEIYDFQGRILQKSSLSKISIADYKTGQYFAKIYLKGGAVQTKRFLVN